MHSLIEEALVIIGQAQRSHKEALRHSLDAAKSAHGTVTRYEFRRALETCSIHVSFQTASQLMDWLCEPGKTREKISVNEFWRRIERVEAFEKADSNHDGVLSRLEVVNMTEQRGRQESKPVSVIKLAASDVASTPVPAKGMSAVEELHMGRKLSMFTPKSEKAVESFLSRYETRGGVGGASTPSSSRPSRSKEKGSSTTDTKDLNNTQHNESRQACVNGTRHKELVSVVETSDRKNRESTTTTTTTTTTINTTATDGPELSRTNGIPSTPVALASGKRGIHNTAEDAPETSFNSQYLPESVTRAVDAAVAHAMKKSSSPSLSTTATATTPSMPDGKSYAPDGINENDGNSVFSSSSGKRIKFTPGSVEEENHLLYAKLHRANFNNASLEREISSLKELLLKAQRDGSLHEKGSLPLTADTPIEEAAEGLVSKVEGKGKKMLVASITEIITRLRSETLRREVAENAVTLSGKSFSAKNEEMIEQQKQRDREKAASINKLRAEIEQKSNTISILQDKLEGAENALINEKQARKQSEDALASAMKQQREERLSNDKEKSILSEEVRETLLSLKDQVLAEQKRREVIDNEVRTLRGALLRCKEDVIVEREKLRSQAESLLERERKVLGKLVSQLEEAAQDNKKLEDYSTEMENVYLSLKQLHSSLRLRDDVNGHKSSGEEGDLGRTEEDKNTVNGYTYGIDSEASWAKLAEALPAQLHPEGGGHVTAAKVLVDHRQQMQREEEEKQEYLQKHYQQQQQQVQSFEINGDDNDNDDDTASIIAALTGLRSEISSLLPDE